jgi:hypothetical protein
MQVAKLSRVITLVVLLLFSNLTIATQNAVSDDKLKMPALEKGFLLSPIAERLSGGVWVYLKGIVSKAESRVEALRKSERVQAPAPALIPYREPSAKFSRTVIVTQDLGRYPYQVEPSISVNLANPDNIIIGAIDYQYFGVVAYVSIDEGATWEGPKVMKPMKLDDWTADPVVRFSRNGTAYYSYLSIGFRPVIARGLLFIAEIASVVISKSTDGGFTWFGPYLAASGDATTIGPPGNQTIVIRFLDKPWMNVGPDPDNPEQDNVYITYTEFILKYPVIEEYPYIMTPTVEVSIKLVASKDGGKTWSKPVTVSPVYSYLQGELDKPLVQGSMPIVARDGTVYVGYYDSHDDGPWKGLFSVMITRSKDAGKTWSKPVEVATMHEMDYYLRPTLFRAWSSMFAYFAVGPEGNLYSVFAAKPPDSPDPADIYFTRSLDGGITWSKPKRINDDETLRGQFFPFIAVDEKGTIHIIWGDMRDDPSSTKYHIYYTWSEDQGETFGLNSRVSDYPSNPMQGIPEFVGDYFEIAAGKDDVYLAWVDCRTGLRGIPNEDIAFARIKPVPSPTIFVSPPNGPAGQMVTISGFNFASYYREVFIYIDGTQVSSIVTDKEGRFKLTLFMPALGEGAHTIAAVDVTGNFATASFYITFGFNNVQDEFKRLKEEISKIPIRNVTRVVTEKPKEAIAPTVDVEMQKEIMKRVNAFGETITNKVDSLDTSLNTRLDSLASMVWIVAFIAVLAMITSVASLIVMLRRKREV